MGSLIQNNIEDFFIANANFGVSHSEQKQDIDIGKVTSIVSAVFANVARGVVAHTIMISDLRHDNIRLANPIPVCIEEELGNFTAVCYDVGQYGHGPSTDDAIADLCDALVEYHVLLINEPKLSKALKSHLAFLNRVIVPLP